MTEIHTSIDEWVQQGFIGPHKKAEALRVANAVPGASQWLTFIDRLLLWGGAVMISAAVIFFFAYNWQAMGSYLKFGLVQLLIIAAIACYWRFPIHSAPGKAALFAASVFVGVLFALFGQTYQTGADTYELFAIWALAILPFALAGRLPALWMLVIVLTNLGIWFYFYTFSFFGVLFATQQQLWLLFVVNTAVLVIWETAHVLGFSWLEERWAPCILGLASGGLITALGIYAIVSMWKISNLGTVLLVYLAWLGAFYAWYRVRCLDMFMLAVGVLSVIIMITTFLGNALIRNSHGDNGGIFLIMGLLVIGLSAAGGFWLKTIAGEVKS